MEGAQTHAMGKRKASQGPIILQPQSTIPSKIVEPLQQEITARIKQDELRTPAFFMVMFTFQKSVTAPQISHTFASFVRVSEDGRQQWSTISWLPESFAQSKSLCVWSNIYHFLTTQTTGSGCSIERGHVYTLQESLNFARESHAGLGIWGPYQITRGLYEQGVDRIDYLKSGAIGYLADDQKTRKSREAISCTHAISDLEDFAPIGGLLINNGFGMWGVAGTQHVLEHMKTKGGRWFLDPVEPNGFRVFGPMPNVLPHVKPGPLLGVPGDT